MFDTHALEVLEFPRIRSAIARNAVSGMGRDALESAQPATDPREVERRLRDADEIVKAVRWGDPIPMRGVQDIRAGIGISARPGSRLDPSTLLDIAQTVECVALLRSHFASRSEKYPRLWVSASALEACPDLAETIGRAIDPSGLIRDAASPKLARVRRDLEQARVTLRSNLERLVNRLGGDVLTDRIVALRNGRPVLPVRSHFRNSVGGIVHDESASGQTVFVEPFEAVEDANRIRQLEIAEQHEIERILTELTDQVRRHSPKLAVNVQVLTHLDALYALGVYAEQSDAAVARIADDEALEIVEMRHPILDERLRSQGDSAVPITCRLYPDTRLMVISGPNAGGKTVALKTLGLAIVMTQAGFPIPANPLTAIPVFESLFAEIGDEQSIENDLSTFSSRMSHLARICDEAKQGVCVLVDELGSATDPDQGAALSRAILSRVCDQGARAIVTTHLGSLKEFAHGVTWAVNASMEFDRQSLRPTFRLIAGIPGSSYALEISRRVGLAPDVIAEAERVLGSSVETENLIADLAHQLEEAERLNRQLLLREKDLSAREQEYESRFARVAADRKRLAQEAREGAEKILHDARALVERTVAEIRRTQGDSVTIKEARAEINDALAVAREALRETATPAGDLREEIPVGSWVKIVNLNKTGEVVAIGKDRVTIQMGAARLEVDPLNVEKVADMPPSRPKGGVAIISTAAQSFIPEVDVRGLDFEDAWEKVDRYLDDAFMARYPRVRIIHGKGTGVLRRKINTQLEQDERISSRQMGEYYEGGAGVTVVDIRLS
jgi:DNA mismatch repair protein MutS2